MGSNTTPPLGGYPPFTPPPCIVMLSGPEGNLQLENIGGGTWINPFTGMALVGSDSVCSLAAAQQIAAELSAVTKVALQPTLPNMGAFMLAADPEVGGAVLYGTDPADVNLYQLVDEKGNLITDSAEALIRQQNFRGIGVLGYWVYAAQELNQDTGQPLPNIPAFKGPVLQWIWGTPPAAIA
jgi:hypothetical protein